MTWTYKGSAYTPPEEVQGYVYLITNLTNGKKYIGKKNFWTTKKLPPLKGKVNRRHKTSPSDWMDYYGSSDNLQADVTLLGKHSFKREILKLCTNKTMMSYWETKLQFEYDVLTRSDFYNEFISCRINSRGLRDEP